MYGRLRRIHFIGIGGSGMSGLAEVLLNLGYAVSGSDQKNSEVTQRLSRLGGRIFYDHNENQIEGAQVVVFSSAITSENPELVEARRRGLPVIPRAELLSELMRMKFGVAIAGAHGKTTTTTLVGSVLAAGGLDPTVVVGGRVQSFGSNARLGQGQFLVAEADESDGSFLRLTPAISVITNLDLEHLDHYKDFDEIRDAFSKFMQRVPFYGLIIGCADDPEVVRLLEGGTDRRIMTYGLRNGRIQARNLELGVAGARFEVWCDETLKGEVETELMGEHNVQNALAAVAVGCELEIPFALIRQGLMDFSGVDRRFDIKGDSHGFLVIDDYAHHPTEIRATLAAARSFDRRIVAVFQPHRYSRTQFLADRFGDCFDDADIVIVTDIYAAGEDPIPGISAETIVGAAQSHGHREVIYAGDLSRARALLREKARPQDIVLTLGAGDIWKVGEGFLSDLERGAPEPTGGRS